MLVWTAYLGIALFAVIAGAGSSFVNLVLIVDMRRWNDHTYMIFAVALFQFVYDITIFNLVLDDVYLQKNWYLAVSKILGGVTASIITNEISYATLYMTQHRKSFDIKENVKILALVAMSPSILLLLYFFYCYFSNIPLSQKQDMLGIGWNIYNYLRLVSMALNIMAWLYSEKILYDFRKKNEAQASEPITDEKLKEVEQDGAITILVNRMKYYQIVQAFSRSGYSLYEMIYGFQFEAPPGTFQYDLLCMAVIVVVIAPIGSLVIFIYNQKGAIDHIKCRLTCKDPFTSPFRARPTESLSEINRISVAERMTAFENLPDGELLEIVNHERNSVNNSIAERIELVNTKFVDNPLQANGREAKARSLPRSMA